MLRVTGEMRKIRGTSIYKESAKTLGKFVRYIEGSLYRTPPFFNFPENYQNVHYIQV